MANEQKGRFASYWYAVLSGCLLFLSAPIAGYYVLLAVALVPFFLCFYSLHSLRARLLATFLMALPHTLAAGFPLFWLAGSWWLSENMVTTNLLYIAGIMAIILIAALSYVLAVFLASRVTLRIPRPLIFGALFALIEFARAYLYAGYSWGGMGYLLIDTTYIKHVASILGVYGLTFVFVVWSSWFAQVALRMVSMNGKISMRIRDALFLSDHFYETITIAMLLLSALLFGVQRESRAPDLGLDLRVAVIASLIRTEDSIGEGAYRAYRTLLKEAIASSPDIILTPENVFPFFMVDEISHELVPHPLIPVANVSDLYDDFLALTKGSPHTTFAVALHTLRFGVLHNSIVLYRDGGIVSMYHKRVPVLFTERVPLGLDIVLFEEFARGDDKQDFRSGELLLGGYICSEIGITPLSVHGAKLILSPSNDSALAGETIAGVQHQFARMRALEAGAYMLRASKGGVSSIIDPYGRAIGTLSGSTGVLVADIR